jgi:surface antigen
MSVAHGSGKGVLPTRSRFLATLGLATWQVPAIVAIAGLPAFAGHSAARGPSSIVCAGYASCSTRGHSSHGYAAHARASYWRMTAGNECTNYVAYVESAAFRAPEPRYLLGNAGQWAATAAAHGVPVNRRPTVGAVAEWDGGAPGMGPAGHVAVVEKVGPRDRYIVISQQHIGSDPDGYDWTRINAGFPASTWQEWPDHFIHFAAAGAGVGYYNSRSSTFHLRSMPGLRAFRRGTPGAVPLIGDWDGSGADGTGTYDPATAWFHLRDQPGAGRSTKAFRFGPPGMIPLAGNWDGRGGTGIGYYDPKTGTFHLRNRLSGGRARDTFRFGPPGMIPLAGDWTGSGRTGIGYYNPRTGWFHLREHLSAGRARFVFRFGPRRMKPVAGNWGGGRRAGIGFYNPRTGWFHLRNRLSAGPASEQFRFGPRGMVPLAGNWR